MKNKSIVYKLGGAVYINLTNRCPCNCEFCVRQYGDAVGDSSGLWLEAEPTASEVITELTKYSLTEHAEVVYCGYGEPAEALDVLLDTARFLKSRNIKTRLNTNGLSDLINNKPTAKCLLGLIDTVSISLNASSKERYNELCHPKFGEDSFNAVLRFAKECKIYVPSVILTVVDIIGADEIRKCQEIADSIGIALRIRKHIT